MLHRFCGEGRTLGRVRALPAVLGLLALGGCTEWVKPGATPQMRDAALARCEAAAYQLAPPSTLQVMTSAGGWEPGKRECTGEGQNRRCRETQGTFRPPTYSTRDQNSPARTAFVEDCMRQDGWVER